MFLCDILELCIGANVYLVCCVSCICCCVFPVFLIFVSSIYCDAAPITLKAVLFPIEFFYEVGRLDDELSIMATLLFWEKKGFQRVNYSQGCEWICLSKKKQGCRMVGHSLGKKNFRKLANPCLGKITLPPKNPFYDAASQK